ncbi:MAG: hypothetical protein H6905_06905 [Hyphomicrobiales bacterium]|nr:hypothetical protein [Hyphomicrobiales bacterium]
MFEQDITAAHDFMARMVRLEHRVYSIAATKSKSTPKVCTRASEAVLAVERLLEELISEDRIDVAA